MNSKKVTTDKYSMTKGSELYAFWEYDTPPYVLGGVASHNSQLISHSAVNGRVVRPGQIYRHFKGNIVRVLQVAQNSELPGQYSVVYECGNSKTVWCRPYDMFLSEVDHEKYPNVTQKYRFELVKE